MPNGVVFLNIVVPLWVSDAFLGVKSGFSPDIGLSLQSLKISRHFGLYLMLSSRSAALAGPAGSAPVPIIPA